MTTYHRLTDAPPSDIILAEEMPSGARRFLAISVDQFKQTI